MAKLWITLVAAKKFASPPWLAVMEHVPVATAVMTKPATVQMPVVVDVKVTVRDDEEVGATVCVDPPRVIADGVPKVIV